MNNVTAWTLGALIGFSGGFLVSGGVVALIVGLGIASRFIGISHGAEHIRGYESAVCLGGIVGNLMVLYQPELLRGTAGGVVLLVTGLFWGLFVGGWILALAELLRVFPVFIRRFQLTKGIGWIVIALAVGKTTGSLLEFYLKWGKN